MSFKILEDVKGEVETHLGRREYSYLKGAVVEAADAAEAEVMKLLSDIGIAQNSEATSPSLPVATSSPTAPVLIVSPSNVGVVATPVTEAQPVQPVVSPDPTPKEN